MDLYPNGKKTLNRTKTMLAAVKVEYRTSRSRRRVCYRRLGMEYGTRV